MKILIAGDYAPKDRIQSLLDKGNYSFFDKVRQITSAYDFSILNLEAPIVENTQSSIIKSGPALKTTPNVVDSIKYSGFDCVTLANNHFRDYGDVGVNTTLRILKETGIKSIGGGSTLAESQKNLIIEIGDKKVGFINVCEHEFSIATKNRGGSAPLDIIDVSLRIKQLNNLVDFIIVIVHGGHEYYQLPSSRMKKTYRFFVDEGADVVINHHQHCYSGYEVYRGKPIFYGLGNFCFDWNNKRNSTWNQGFMVGLVLSEEISFELYPYEQCDKTPSINLLTDHNKQEFLKTVFSLNSIITNDEILEKEFDKFCSSKNHSIKSTFSPLQGRFMRGLAKYNLMPYFLPTSKILSILNHVQCESHRDLVCNVLKRGIEK